MKNFDIKKIIQLCLQLDESAVEIYQIMALKCEEQEHRTFWQKAAAEEISHVKFWKRLLALASKGGMPQIVANPVKVYQELQQNQKKIAKLISRNQQDLTLTTCFLIALRLEFCLLHPVFEDLWRFSEIIWQSGVSPEDAYNEHLDLFINAMQRFGSATPELELLGEVIQNLWQHIKQMSTNNSTDELTQVLNRHNFFQTIKTLAYLAKRNHFTTAIIIIDIDNFKQINDTNGHPQGDMVLHKTAALLKSSVRKSDLVGRYGGDEFLVFMPQIKKGILEDITQKICQAVAEHDFQGLQVTVSTGAACKAIGGEIDAELHDLLCQADKLLYTAKNKGKNQAQIEYMAG